MNKNTIKTKLVKNSSGEFIIKASIRKGGKTTIKYFSPEDLGFSNVEIPYVDYRTKVLSKLRS